VPGQNLVWYGTTGTAGTAEGQSQASPAAWLGKWRASQTLHSLQSTLTASQSAQSRSFLVDSAQIGAGAQAHRLKWLVLVTGPAAPAAARVASFDSATGTYKLDRPLPAAAASGNTYRLFSRNNVWPDVSAAQASAGETRYRCIVFRNEHAATLAAVRIYFLDLSAGGADCQRLHQTAYGTPFLSRANDQTDLLDSLGQRQALGGSDAFDGSGPWQNPFGFAVADTLVANLGQNASIAVWLRRRIPAGVQFRRSVALQIVAETTTTGSDPSPLITSAVMAYDVAADAATPAASIERDRYVQIGGGTRLRGAVTRGAGPEAARAVRWRLRSGDGGALYTDDDPSPGYATTDGSGVVYATYHAPEDAADEGADAQAQLVVIAGDELGDPQPRIALAAAADFGESASGDLTLPSLTESFDEDLAAPLWAAIG
jgi:hypothetical protein